MSNFKDKIVAAFVAVFIAIALFVGIGILIVIWQITERDRNFKPYSSYLRLLNLADGVDYYKANHGIWPTNLNQLILARPDLLPNLTDGYGRPVVFLAFDDSAGYGAVITYGRDGKPGGNNRFDRDIEIRFPMDVATNTQWNLVVSNWFQTREERGVP